MSARSSRLQAAVLTVGLLLPGQAMSDMTGPVLRHAPAASTIWALAAKALPDRVIVLDDDAVAIRKSCRDGVYAYKARERTLDARRRAFDESKCDHFAKDE